MWSIPNILTLFRIVLIPVFLVVYYLPWEHAHFAGAFIFWLASVTDILDGYLARKLQQSTPFGAFLDPVADKLMVVSALVLLVDNYQSLWIAIPAVIIIGREVLVSALREWMAERGRRGSVAVSNIGKYKTAAQMLALIGLLSDLWFFVWPGYLLLYIAVVLTFWSMVEYMRAAWSDLIH